MGQEIEILLVSYEAVAIGIDFLKELLEFLHWCQKLQIV